MSAREDLIAAKALIDAPEKWIKFEFERAGCYCALGATRRVAMSIRNDAMYASLRRALPVGEPSVSEFNDHPDTTHADIMALFDRAIEAAP